MQYKVKVFNDNRTCHKKPMPVYARLCDISSEMGELIKEYLKASHYGTSEFVLTPDFEEEFGDVLYALLSLANETNINCEKSLDIVLKKLQDRMNKNSTMGSGR